MLPIRGFSEEYDTWEVVRRVIMGITPFGGTNALLIADAQHLNEIVLHAPFGKHALEIVCMSDELYAEAEKLVRVLSDWELKLGRSVTLLYHVSLPVESLKHLAVLEKFKHLLDSSSIKFLLENSYASLSAGKKRMQEDPILYVLEGVRNKPSVYVL